MSSYLSKTVITAAIIGSGLTFGYKQYTKDVTIVYNDCSNEPEVVNKLIKEKTSRKPICISYRIPIKAENSLLTPETMVESMFSSLTMVPEKIILWCITSKYEPMTKQIGHSIFGMFKVEVLNPKIAVLNWKLGKMEGLHIYHRNENVAMFDTIVWSSGTISPLLEQFHHIYSKLLLVSAVNS
ncbi:hypothetical protein C6P40_000245 [Pichia californica]|uniref:Uncharacterized protein n=1 Tax=Pichia californica TaxID=460514 RepID=A0A9P6WKV4_9ASCO|nr:hypothetical protein C6P42_000384 [[Candida] californica]KAG0688986.1 hypothetical protein C6P40_000245 [[Candida] californica]